MCIRDRLTSLTTYWRWTTTVHITRSWTRPGWTWQTWLYSLDHRLLQPVIPENHSHSFISDSREDHSVRTLRSPTSKHSHHRALLLLSATAEPVHFPPLGWHYLPGKIFMGCCRNFTGRMPIQTSNHWCQIIIETFRMFPTRVFSHHLWHLELFW